jgi:tetratricopeptide (TPR) repeat protein
VSYVYPSHHRRYVFMSVGGYWPSYSYARYYWYDCHPWYWYGAAPVAYQVDSGDTYNYYTYNTYNTGSGISSTGPLTPGTVVNGVEVPDYDALRTAGRQATVPPQAAPQAPPQEPAAPTESDKLFDAGVTTFGDGNYPGAIEKFQRAVRLEPNDVILPFAYAQALFANTDYEQAAAVLQTALGGMAPAKPEVFFPRGLYKDEAVLAAQIKSLERAVMMNPANSALQLLYGYQLMGIGKMDDAKVPLGVAQRDARTAGPASILLDLIERTKAESQKKK